MDGVPIYLCVAAPIIGVPIYLCVAAPIICVYAICPALYAICPALYGNCLFGSLSLATCLCVHDLSLCTNCATKTYRHTNWCYNVTQFLAYKITPEL